MESLPAKYGVNIVFVPKFHCELNPIEGVWGHQKQFVRKHSDQTFQRLLEWIDELRKKFIEKKIFLKLFRSFWKTMHAYARGQSYDDVLKLFFSNNCSSMITSHRKTTNNNLTSM